MDLASGCEAAERVLSKANEAVNRDLLDEALEDLTNRVEDWKNHQVQQFGRLLMHGVYGVITGKTDQEKDVSCPFSDFIPFSLTLPVRNLPFRVYPPVLQGDIIKQEQG